MTGFTGCLRAMRGWLAACAAATVFLALVIAANTPNGTASGRFGVGWLFPALLIFLIMCLLTGIPAAFVIWLGKKFQLRSFWFFGAAGAVIGALSQTVVLGLLVLRWPSTSLLFVLAGLIAGLVYWWVVERQ